MDVLQLFHGSGRVSVQYRAWNPFKESSWRTSGEVGKKFYHDNKDIIDMKTKLSDEEQEHKDALNEKLNRLGGG